jgi:diguanylate cyclase (GGDEF)-like protein
VPLSTKEGVIGVMTTTSRKVGVFQPDHEDLLQYLGAAVVRDLDNARLYRASISDPLTRAYNRQYLIQRLPDEVERCRRYGDPLSLALFDLDHFKRFNETYGGPAGDFVLKEIARIALAQIRDVDALVRHGDDEFLVLLPNTNLPGATVIAERFRKAVEVAEFPWSDRRLSITVSIGLASLGENAPTDDALLRKVDEALQRAKAQGRNRVEAAA